MRYDNHKSPDSRLSAEYSGPSRILWSLYALIVGIFLFIVIAIQGYKYMFPENPADQLNRAIEALNTGENAIAQRLFHKLAANGNPAAEYWLGDMNETGIGTSKDLAAAEKFFLASAAKGFVPSELRLGELYLAGTQIDPNFSKAAEWLDKAAKAQNGKAQRLLGQMYAAGMGRPSDPFLASVYFSAATSNGDRLANAERDRLAPQLTEEQLSAIKSMVAKLGLVK